MQASKTTVPQSGIVCHITTNHVRYSYSSSETDDFCVSVLSRHAIRMSASFFLFASPAALPYRSYRRVRLQQPQIHSFSGSVILRHRKFIAFMGWLAQTEKAQLDAIEWFVTTFPPSIQERARTFLKGPIS